MRCLFRGAQQFVRRTAFVSPGCGTQQRLSVLSVRLSGSKQHGSILQIVQDIMRKITYAGYRPDRPVTSRQASDRRQRKIIVKASHSPQRDKSQMGVVCSFGAERQSLLMQQELVQLLACLPRELRQAIDK